LRLPVPYKRQISPRNLLHLDGPEARPRADDGNQREPPRAAAATTACSSGRDEAAQADCPVIRN